MYAYHLILLDFVTKMLLVACPFVSAFLTSYMSFMCALVCSLVGSVETLMNDFAVFISNCVY